jgi:hypothetical protein
MADFNENLLVKDWSNSKGTRKTKGISWRAAEITGLNLKTQTLNWKKELDY